MGWSFGMFNRCRKDFIDSITSQQHYSKGYTPLEHRVVGNNVYQLVRIEAKNRVYIALTLIAKERNGGWGYKGLNEDMFPYQVDCPLSLLNKADPTPNANAQAWRAKVREYHASKKAKIKPSAGMVLHLGGTQYRLDEPHQNARKGWVVTRMTDGARFRAPCHQINAALAGCARAQFNPASMAEHGLF